MTSILFLIFKGKQLFWKRSNSTQREVTLLKEKKKLCAKGWELICSRLWHKRQRSSCTIILSIIYQTLKKHINHVYENQTCIDVIYVGVSAFSECFLFWINFSNIQGNLRTLFYSFLTKSANLHSNAWRYPFSSSFWSLLNPVPFVLVKSRNYWLRICTHLQRH